MKPEWIEYTGSDEQINEIANARDGFILRIVDVAEYGCAEQTDILQYTPRMLDQLKNDNTITHYLICQPHPYADMIDRWRQTGQPVWIREHHETWADGILDSSDGVVYITHTPNWHIPGAEYSFTPFEGEVCAG